MLNRRLGRQAFRSLEASLTSPKKLEQRREFREFTETSHKDSPSKENSDIIKKIALSDDARNAFEHYTIQLDKMGKNPYTDYKNVAKEVSTVLESLLSFRERNIIREDNVVLMTNGPRDSTKAFLTPRSSYYDTSFEYAKDPSARGRNTFVAEWVELALCTIRGRDPYIHSRLHLTPNGEGNIFHQVRPREADMGKQIASQGAGAAPWHRDATPVNQFRSLEEAKKHYESLGVDMEKAARVLGVKTPENVFEQAMKNTQKKPITDLILAYTGAGENHTSTSLLTARDFTKGIVQEFGVEGLKKLAHMNIAYMSGAIEGKNAGNATIGRMVTLNENGEVREMRIKLDKGRMVYIGIEGGKETWEDFYENDKFFNQVCDCLKKIPGTQVLLQAGDYLIFNNYGVGHRRDKIDPRDLQQPLEEGRPQDIRNLTRLYLTVPDKKSSNQKTSDQLVGGAMASLMRQVVRNTKSDHSSPIKSE